MLRQAIDRAGPLPVYAQLKALLLEEILRGRYGPGERLPTEHELCAAHGISRTSVRRALAQLTAEGVILRRRRHGSFVNPHWVQPRLGTKELRVLVPEGPWETLVRDAAPSDVTISTATVNFTDLHQALVHAVAEGRAPDIAVADSVWVHEFAASGFLTPLDDLDPGWVSGEYERDFLEPFRSANTYRGRPVAVQAEADVAGVWYRRSDIASVASRSPLSWDDLADVGRRLVAGGKPHPLAIPGGSRGGETTTYCLLALLASNGTVVIDSGEITLDAPATIECLAYLRRLVTDGVVAADAVTHDRERPIRALAHGGASLAFGGSYDAPALAAAASLPKDKVLDEFGFQGMPAGPRAGPRGGAGTLAGGMVYVIFRQATNPGLAMRVLRGLVSTDALVAMSRSTWQIATRRSAVSLAAADSPFLSGTGGLLEQAVVRPSTLAYARVSAQLQAMLEAVLVGWQDPAEASARTAEMIAAITGLPIRHGSP